MSSMLTPLPLMPLVPHVLTQAYSVAMVRANPSLCRTALLAHPRTAARLSRFHAALHALALALPGALLMGIPLCPPHSLP